MDHLKFMIESHEAEAMAKKHGLKSVLHLLPLIVRSTRKLARPPISGFSVSAAGLSSDGRIFIGVNVEFPGLPLHHSIHAEQFLITNLSRYPDTTLTNVVVSAYPCGHCRQFLQEIRGAPDIQIYVLQDDDYDHDHDHDQLVKINGFFRPLSYFLPHRFGPDDLLEKDVPLILETHENGLVLVDEFTKGQNGNLNLVANGFSSDVISAALEAANRSHAPYSGYPSGMALIDDKGNVYKGSYMESAAYNPSLGPVQAAVIAYIAAARDGAEAEAEDGYGYGRIVGGVLVEKEGAAVRQEETVRLFLKTVMPNCAFHVYHCKDSSSPIKGESESELKLELELELEL
ncbi:cytidine deaminase 1 [Silene latifolia]|uniref:cytidine deaminase 1 n=1 Tax=Silene latifolia TaxID=37657 RepID=UPI003D7811F5